MQQRRKILSIPGAAALGALLGPLLAAPARAAPLAHSDIGIIMMHGKWGRPPGPLAGLLGREDYQVVSPTMPWSGGRLYDTSYPAGLTELHAAVEKLRAAGARLVVVGGESFGANGTLAYQAQYGDADALILLAPGHNPGGWYRSGLIKAEVDEARALRNAGRGGERFTFTDPNQDNNRKLSATVDHYLSFFNPLGLANMGVSARRIAAHGRAVPVLLVNSSNEARTQGRGFIWNELPAHPASVYAELSAGHSEAAEAAASLVRRFLETLAAGAGAAR